MKTLRSYQLAVEFYKKAKSTKLPGHVGDQFRRASLSIALNLAEGTGKKSMKDRVRFFQIALGSIRECQSIMELEADRFTEDLHSLIDQVGASTFVLIQRAPV